MIFLFYVCLFLVPFQATASEPRDELQLERMKRGELVSDYETAVSMNEQDQFLVEQQLAGGEQDEQHKGDLQQAVVEVDALMFLMQQEELAMRENETSVKTESC